MRTTTVLYPHYVNLHSGALQLSAIVFKRKIHELKLGAIILIGLVLFCMPLMGQSQSVGDYRSTPTTVNWNAAATWERWNGTAWVLNPAQGYPGQNTGTGKVTVRNGHAVVLNISPAENIGSLDIGTGAAASLTLGNNNTNRILKVSGTVTVNASATLTTVGNGGNELRLAGNLVNNGTFDLRVGAATANLLFNGANNQTLSGTGATTDFDQITINNSGTSPNNIIEILSSNFTAAAGFLTLTRGVIKFSGTYTLSNTVFGTANPVINADEGIWLNNPNMTVTAQGGDTELSGLLRISAGTYNIGTGSDWWLFYNSGAVITIEGGALNVSGALYGSLLTSTVTYTQTSGTVTVNTAGNTLTYPSFGIEATGSVFNMSGGTIIFQRAETGGYYDYYNVASTNTVTGGTIQFGNASTPASSIFRLYSTTPFYDLQLNNTNSPTLMPTTATTYKNDLTIGGTLDAATFNVNITIERNWINNGVFTPGTATVTFNSTTQAQTIGGTASTTFYNLTNNNTNATGLSTLTNTTVSRTLTLASATNGKINIGSNNLTIGSGGSISGANSSRYIITVPTTTTNGRLRQNNLSTSARVFPIGTAALYLPATVTASTAGSDFSIAVFRSTTVNGSPSGAGFGSRLHQVDAVWQIDRPAGASNAHIRLDWFTNSIEGSGFTGLTNTAIGIWRYTGSGWLLIPTPTLFSNDNTANYASTVSTAMTNFGTAGTGYPYIVANVTVLPSALKSFAAQKRNNGNQLNWVIENASQYKSFEVQSAANGVAFQPLATINAAIATNYTYTDAFAGSTTTYYRLKLTDLQGNITYSHVVAIAANKETKISLLQNPVQQDLIFKHPEAVNAYYTIVDAMGRVLLKGQLNEHAVISTIQAGTLSKGTYILQITDGTEQYTTRFIKQ